MIRPERTVLLASIFLLSSCQRHETETDSYVEAAIRSPKPGSGNFGAKAKSAASNREPLREASSDGRSREIVLSKDDVTIGVEPACAITVQYAKGNDQRVIWRGEICVDLGVHLMSVRDLAELGHGAKLSKETRGDVARLPHQRALYIEGAFTSAIYPQDRQHRVYTVPLAD